MFQALREDILVPVYFVFHLTAYDLLKSAAFTDFYTWYIIII